MKIENNFLSGSKEDAPGKSEELLREREEMINYIKQNDSFYREMDLTFFKLEELKEIKQNLEEKNKG